MMGDEFIIVHFEGEMSNRIPKDLHKSLEGIHNTKL